ncbi:Chymotrypsin-like elastase family member 3B [Collichthys lucidus]|uniref:Chymotrypsin-like elastase family member 3B n=1 Tax=Collichthys lucidus TaxID=240159 RepID=A0A4U5UKQ8_COLLU|nr:Chymotrypsin-like elastase family member 3B [Collichthys lucidus]
MTSVQEVNPVVRGVRAPTSLSSHITSTGDQTEYKSDAAHSEGPLWGIMMKLGLVLLFAAYVHGCGTPTYEPSVSRVVNGVDARPYSWPWQISLQYLSGSTSVERIVVHPHWDDNCLSCGNDIAMIKLASPVDLNDKVQPSCLPESGQIVPNNDPCYITGWGRLYSGGPIASKLQQALLPVVGHSICSRSDWWGSTVKTTMVCAGGDIRSGCHGDSGGPLNCRGGDGRWYVQGVTSFVSSRGCNTPLKPTVFTRTSSFTKWISDTLLQY